MLIVRSAVHNAHARFWFSCS